jgi:glyoxylate reductase
MSKPFIYVTRGLPERGLGMLAAHFDTEVWPGYDAPPKSILAEKAETADGLATFVSDSIDAKLFESAPRLKIVAQMAVGFDNIDVAEATKRKICVTNTPDVLTETTADFAWALLMAVARRVVEADRYVRNGQWKVGWHPKMLLGRDLHGATLGIVGLGRIGGAIARRAKGFGMRLLYYDVERKTDVELEDGIEFAPIDELFRASDFITMNLPLTKATYHFVDETKLRTMKSDACLINNARGPVVDERALFTALSEGWIAGAGLDVFETEPIRPDNPLLTLDNLVVAPHISSASFETRSRMAEMVASNLVAFFEGRRPPNMVNPEAWQRPSDG